MAGTLVTLEAAWVVRAPEHLVVGGHAVAVRVGERSVGAAEIDEFVNVGEAVVVLIHDGKQHLRQDG